MSRLACELVDVTLHVSDSSGHDVGVDHSGEIVSVLASLVQYVVPAADQVGTLHDPEGPGKDVCLPRA